MPLFFASVIFLGGFFLQAKPLNLLRNGSFEEGMQGWYPIDVSGRGKVEFVEGGIDGSKALRLHRNGGNGVVMVRQNLRGFPGGRNLKISVSYRSLTGGNASVSIWGYDAKNDAPLLERDVIALTGKKKEWERKEIEVKVSDKVLWMAVGIRVLDDGEFFFDDVKLQQQGIHELPGSLLRNGGFELGLLDWELELVSACAIAKADAAAKRSGGFGLRYQRGKKCEREMDLISTRMEKLPPGEIQIKAQLRAKQANCAIELRFFDAKGEFLQKSEIGKTTQDAWTAVEGKASVPEQAKSATVCFLISGEGHVDLDEVIAE